MSQPLPRFLQTHIILDPLELALAQREAQAEAARQALAAGATLDADPQDLRGIPCIARGVTGTATETTTLLRRIERETIRRRPTGQEQSRLPVT